MIRKKYKNDASFKYCNFYQQRRYYLDEIFLTQ